MKNCRKYTFIATISTAIILSIFYVTNRFENKSAIVRLQAKAANIPTKHGARAIPDRPSLRLVAEGNKIHSNQMAKLHEEFLTAIETGNNGECVAKSLEIMNTYYGAELMMEIFQNENLSTTCRQYAADALIGEDKEILTKEVVATAINQMQIGKPEVGEIILSALKTPVGIEGAKGITNILLGKEESSRIKYPLPFKVQITLQKALLNSSSNDEVGELLAKRYLELNGAGERLFSDQLLNKFAHPSMLVELLVQATIDDRKDKVSEYFDRLASSDGPSFVGAVIRLGSRDPSLLSRASECMFNWSFDHSQNLQSGQFADYLNDQALPPEQRTVAAYGLAGLIGRAEAALALEKAISLEKDSHTKDCFQTALASLRGGGGNQD